MCKRKLYNFNSIARSIGDLALLDGGCHKLYSYVVNSNLDEIDYCRLLFGLPPLLQKNIKGNDND